MAAINKEKKTTQSYNKCWMCSLKTIANVGNMNLKAGSRAEVERYFLHGGKAILAFDLLGGTKYHVPSPPIIADDLAVEILGERLTTVRAADPVGVVEIDWQDHGVPYELDDRRWWKELADKLATLDGNVIVNCMGGHGRTGTFLAIVCTYLNLIPKDECPVEWVREIGCPEMVESNSQIKYIEEMTGRKCKAEIEDLSFFQSSYGYQGGTTSGATTPGGTTSSNSTVSISEGRWAVPTSKDDLADDPTFDPDAPPAWLDSKAKDRLADQFSLDYIWDQFMCGADMDHNDRALCRWLARKFFYYSPDGDIMNAWYDVGSGDWYEFEPTDDATDDAIQSYPYQEEGCDPVG